MLSVVSAKAVRYNFSHIFENMKNKTETWTWSHGHGDVDMETYTWRQGHGDMDMETKSNGKRKPRQFLNPFTVCSSCKRKFVLCPLFDEETNRS
jgi:hypothetical protein